MKRTLLHVLAVAGLLATLAPPGALATPGDADSGFSGNGFASERFEPNDGVGVLSLAVQRDGKTVAAIAVQRGSGHLGPVYHHYFLTRFNVGGSIDREFGSDGVVELPGVDEFDSHGAVVGLQSDDRIIVTKANPTERGLWAARYDTSGKPDPTFGGGDGDGDGVFSETLPENRRSFATGLAITTADQIVITGTAEDDEGLDPSPIVARLGRDGQLDPSFSGDGLAREPDIGVVGAALEGAAVDSEGRVLSLSYSPTTRSSAVVRYQADGTFDSGFGGDGTADLNARVYTEPADLAVDSQGRAVVTTDAGSYPATSSQVVRLTPLGGFDPTFGQEGVVTPIVSPTFETGRVQDFSHVVLDSEDRPIVAGLDRALVSTRLTTTGAVDPTYSGDGWVRLYRRSRSFPEAFPVTAMAIGPSGLMIGTPNYDGHALLARLKLSDGPADADGDLRLDREERCPLVFGTCPSYERIARLFWDRSYDAVLHGRVTLRGGPQCDLAPAIGLFRVRPGPDRRVARMWPTHPGSFPDFFFDVAARPGQYYARVARTVLGSGICGAARSHRFNVH
jgi:uncharacterized delta-60 repeat protein